MDETQKRLLKFYVDKFGKVPNVVKNLSQQEIYELMQRAPLDPIKVTMDEPNVTSSGVMQSDPKEEFLANESMQPDNRAMAIDALRRSSQQQFKQDLLDQQNAVTANETGDLTVEDLQSDEDSNQRMFNNIKNSKLRLMKSSKFNF